MTLCVFNFFSQLYIKLNSFLRLSMNLKCFFLFLGVQVSCFILKWNFTRQRWYSIVHGKKQRKTGFWEGESNLSILFDLFKIEKNDNWMYHQSVNIHFNVFVSRVQECVPFRLSIFNYTNYRVLKAIFAMSSHAISWQFLSISVSRAMQCRVEHGRAVLQVTMSQRLNVYVLWMLI